MINTFFRIHFDKFIVFFIIPLLLFVVYSPALNGPFLFDDTYIIENNPDIRIKNLSYESLQKNVGGHRPTAMVSFALNFYLHGLSPFWFRVTNIFIHIFVSILLYFLLVKTLSFLEYNSVDRKILSVTSVLVWASHPLQIQSVTYIVQRMNSLSGLFFILSLLIYINARKSKFVLLKIFLFMIFIISVLLSLKSKPNAITIMPIIILYEYFFLSKSRKILLLSSAIIVSFFLVFFYISIKDQIQIIPIFDLQSWYSNREFTLIQNILTQSRVLIFYISLLFFPHPARLNIDHQIFFSKSIFSPISTLNSIAALIILILLAIVIVKRNKFLSFGILWFFITHSVESSIIPLDFIFEHRNYVPSMMFIAGFFSLFSGINRRAIFLFIVVLTVATFSFWTYKRNFLWKSGLSLWADSVKKSPSNSRAHESYAFYLEQEGYVDKSILHYEKAIELNPRGVVNSNIYNIIGTLYSRNGAIEKSLENYKKAFLISGNEELYCLNVANLLYKIKKFKESLEFYKESLKRNKKSFLANLNAGNASMQLRENNLAISYYNEAINVNPENIIPYYNKALLLMQMNNMNKAIDLFLYILQLDPMHNETHKKLALIYEQTGQAALAEKHYKAAIAVSSQSDIK